MLGQERAGPCRPAGPAAPSWPWPPRPAARRGWPARGRRGSCPCRCRPAPRGGGRLDGRADRLGHLHLARSGLAATGEGGDDPIERSRDRPSATVVVGHAVTRLPPASHGASPAPRSLPIAPAPSRSLATVPSSGGRQHTANVRRAAAVVSPREPARGLDPQRIPVHVGCVMDGNGRWAQKRGLKRTDGHAAGEEALFDVVDGALELGITWLTVYAFSTENWRRPVDEVRYLMQLQQYDPTRPARRAERPRRADPVLRPAGLAGAPAAHQPTRTRRSSSPRATAA